MSEHGVLELVFGVKLCDLLESLLMMEHVDVLHPLLEGICALLEAAVV
jgi:hypothetical protein